MTKRLPLLVAGALIIAYAVFFSWFTIGRHVKTNSSRFDLGNMEQTIWNTVHGQVFQMTDPYGTDQISRLAFHADGFLLLIAPLYALVPRTETLLILQTVALAAAGWLIYLIAAKRLTPWWGVGCTLTFLLYPALQWTNIFDWHAVAFSIPFILLAWWGAGERKWAVMFTAMFFALTTKEEIGLLFIVLSWHLWRQRQRQIALWVGGIGIGWSMSMFLFLLPHFSAQTAGSGEVYRSIFGLNANSIMSGAVQHPLRLIQTLLAKQNLVYLWQLLSSTGFFPLGSWVTLGTLPEYVINVLSLKPAQHLIVSHYASGLIPWIFLGLITSIGWIRDRVQKMNWAGAVLAIWLGGWVVYGAWAYGPLPGAQNDWSRFVTWSNPYAAAVGTWEKSIPSTVKVSATNNVGAHFARRQYLYSFPLGVDQSDYVVVLEGHATPVVATQAEVTQQIQDLRQDTQWQQLYQQGDLTILQRR